MGVTLAVFPVSGTLPVGNKLAVFPVSGTLPVGNKLAVFPVSGTLPVGNKLAVFPVSGTLPVGNKLTIFSVSGTLPVGNKLAVFSVSGTLPVGNKLTIFSVSGTLPVGNKLAVFSVSGTLPVGNKLAVFPVSGTLPVGNKLTDFSVSGMLPVGNKLAVFPVSGTLLAGVLWWEGWWSSLWRADFWLPPGITWDHLRNTHHFTFPDFYDVWIYPLLFSLVFIVLRYFLLEPWVFCPLARAAGISSRRGAPPAPNSVLEEVYRQHRGTVPTMVIKEVCEAGQMSQRQVERWLRRRHTITRCTKYDKFLDCAYDFLCHLSFCMLGLSIMYSKPWLWNITLCWQDYPHHSLTSDVWWYYVLCLGYYWSVTFIHLPKPSIKMSARIQMLLHHIFTILLMVFSWTCNFVRVGSVVLVVHECADVPLLAAKLCKHAGLDALTDALFSVFLLLWLFTRCYMYPFWVMRSVFFEATTYMFMPSAYLFMGLLTGLLVLNVVWTVLILAIAVRKLRAGGSLQDYRSSAQETSSSDTNSSTNNLNKTD
ncbi:ceramide synthase 6-like [Cherax quadricarinatus]|uniref:ceramide synthase 6-like n=1 Tax=Cherax quadricarinatus TaxID=27406 RepID=UPI00387EC544